MPQSPRGSPVRRELLVGKADRDIGWAGGNVGGCEPVYLFQEDAADSGGVAGVEEVTVEQLLQELEEEHKRDMDAFASECASREVAIRTHRAAARQHLESEHQARVAAAEEKLALALGRYRPSQSVLDLRMRIRALGLSRRAVDVSEKGRLERELLGKESREREMYKDKMRLEHGLQMSRFKVEAGRARDRFEDETRVLQSEQAQAMEQEYSTLVARYESRKKAIVAGRRARQQAPALHRAHRAGTFTAGSGQVGQVGEKGEKRGAGGGETRAGGGGMEERETERARSVRKVVGAQDRGAAVTVPALELARTSLQTRDMGAGGDVSYRKMSHREGGTVSARGHSERGKGTEELVRVLRDVFANVYEAFVFFDMHGDDFVRAQAFRTQAARLLPTVHPDVILKEIETFSSNHGHSTQVNMRKFIKHFGWGPRLDLAAETEVYETAKLGRGKIVARFEAWRAQNVGGMAGNGGSYSRHAKEACAIPFHTHRRGTGADASPQKQKSLGGAEGRSGGEERVEHATPRRGERRRGRARSAERPVRGGVGGHASVSARSRSPGGRLGRSGVGAGEEWGTSVEGGRAAGRVRVREEARAKAWVSQGVREKEVRVCICLCPPSLFLSFSVSGWVCSCMCMSIFMCLCV